MKRQLVALVVLQAADVFTTVQGIQAGAVEQNPVGVWVLGAGWLGLVAVKAAGLVVIAGIAWLLWRGTELNRVQALVGLRFSCSFMLAVVSWNVWVGWLHGAG